MDFFERPGFVLQNDAGIEVCENRLSCTSPLSTHSFNADVVRIRSRSERRSTEKRSTTSIEIL